MFGTNLSNIIQIPGKEAVIALAIGIVTSSFIASSNRRKVIAAPAATTSVPLQQVPATSVFTSTELEDVTACQENGPDGMFLRGRHGFTHYVMHSPKDADSSKGLVVMATGFGVSCSCYKDFAGMLVDDGFSVLRYDFFGHGYSKYVGENMWVQYSPDMFVDQLEDILDHIGKDEQRGKHIDPVAFIGHSTGGVVGITAADRWGQEGSKRRVIPKLVLVAPALFAKKPFIARIADKIPDLLTSLFKNVPSARVLIGDAYMEGSEIAFGINPETKQYVYPEVQKKNVLCNSRLFGKVKGVKAHPFLSAAIAGINGNTIRDDLLPGHRKKLDGVLKRRGDGKLDALLLWGDLDVTVPFAENVDSYRARDESNDNFSLQVLEQIGHEAFFENSKKVAETALPFLNA